MLFECYLRCGQLLNSALGNLNKPKVSLLLAQILNDLITKLQMYG